MAPNSKPQSKPESTASRRSARLAGSAAPASETKEGKKREASAPRSESTAKKAKTDSSNKAKTTSKATNGTSKPAAETIPEDDEQQVNEKASEEEKKAEAPKSAKADTGGKGPIKLGDSLPSITLQNEKGEDVDVAKLAEGGKGVVSFLYPKADTPGCTTQACGFRDHHAESKDSGYDVYGLSKDKPTAQQKWITKKELNYTLLSDPDSKLIKKLGAFVQPNNTKRSHFIFSKDDGKSIDAQLGVKPANDPANVIDFIKKHHK